MQVVTRRRDASVGVGLRWMFIAVAALAAVVFLVPEGEAGGAPRNHPRGRHLER